MLPTFAGRRAVLLLLLGGVGCGERLYPVRGTVTLEDGSPLPRGLVILEKKEGEQAVMARGEVRPDGTFEMSTKKPGDGVPPGKYRALVNPMDLSDVPDEKKNLPFDIKYLKFETSGLEYEVKSGTNDFPLRLEKSRKARR